MMNFVDESLRDGPIPEGQSCEVCGAIMSGEPMPKRIQRKRTKGWKMPENTVYVGRPTKWGNPYYLGMAYQFKRGVNTVLVGRDSLVKAYREYLNRCIETSEDFLAPIRGKDLACWCPLNQPCHADVLLEIANQNRPWRCLSCGASTGVR